MFALDVRKQEWQEEKHSLNFTVSTCRGSILFPTFFVTTFDTGSSAERYQQKL